MTEKAPTLKRALSLPLITFYGLGNILGAGIYVLIGKMAGHAGYHVPIAFLLASLIAALTALTYAELSSRYPLSAGEAVYLMKGFGTRHLSLLVGLLIILTGIVSGATIAKGFVGYFAVFIRLPNWLVILALISALGGLASWGISQSIRTAALFTLIEVFGLLLILVVVWPLYGALPDKISEFTVSTDIGSWEGIMFAAFLAFYAYVGFEDMVNVAEEVKGVRRNLPLAIILSLVISTLLYIGIAIASLLVLEPEMLAASDAPLAAVYTEVTGRRPLAISVISMIAVVNGALIQIIMASRVCYGLSRQNWLPEILGVVNATTRTPINATILISALIIIMALWFPIETLARISSYFLLITFSLVNLSLWRIKWKQAEAGRDGIFTIPLFIPVLGFFGCLAFLFFQTLFYIS